MKLKYSARLRRLSPTRLALAATAACIAAQPAWAVSEPTVPAGTGQAVVTGSSTVVRASTNPLQLGWHLIARSVQGGYSSDQSNLWNPTVWPDATFHTGSLNPELLGFLASDFEDSFYRYGGNTFDWTATVGSSRLATQMDELGNMPVLFGPDEFLRFVERVKGTPVLIPNFASTGSYSLIDPADDAQWATAKANVRKFFEYVNGCAAPDGVSYVAACDLNGDNELEGNKRFQNGHPAPYNVRYWELGNELDSIPSWNAGIYAQRVQDLVQRLRLDWAVGQSYLKGSLVLLGHSYTEQCDFKAGNCTPTAATEPTASPSNVVGNTNYSPQGYWLKQLWNTTGTQLDGFATHQYYERVWHILARQDYFNYALGYWAGLGGYTARPIYITEHGLYPSDAKNENNWPQTTAIDQSSAGTLGYFDFLSGIAQRPSVRMAVRHDLAAVGPWAAFSPLVSSGGNVRYAQDTQFVPRPLAWASKLAHRALRGTEVLDTAVTTNNTSGTDYDVRAAAYRVPNSSVRGAFLAHRGTSATSLLLTLPGWDPGRWVMRLNGVGGPDATRLWKRYAAVDNVASNQATFAVPALSVMDVRALGANLISNGDFESGTTGWTGSSGCYDVWTHTPTNAVDSDAIHGAKVLRSNRYNGALSCEVSQAAAQNSELGSSGTVVTNPNDTYVLRANVRHAPVSGSVPALGLNPNGTPQTVKLKLTLTGSPSIPAIEVAAQHDVAVRTANYKEDAAGKWEPMEIEFVPANIIGTGTLTSLEVGLFHELFSTLSADFDGITLLRRVNQALVPRLASGNLLSTSWETRVPTGTGNSASFTGAAGTQRAYARLKKNTGGYGVQLVQSNTANSKLSAGQLIDTARNDKWRLRAYVRASGSGVGTDAARLKVQFFDAAGNYLESSPVGVSGTGTVSGPSTAWREITLDFVPAQVIGNNTFGRAEIMVELVGNTSTDGVDVSFVGLERVLD